MNFRTSKNQYLYLLGDFLTCLSIPGSITIETRKFIIENLRSEEIEKRRKEKRKVLMAFL